MAAGGGPRTDTRHVGNSAERLVVVSRPTALGGEPRPRTDHRAPSARGRQQARRSGKSGVDVCVVVGQAQVDDAPDETDLGDLCDHFPGLPLEGRRPSTRKQRRCRARDECADRCLSRCQRDLAAILVAQRGQAPGRASAARRVRTRRDSQRRRNDRRGQQSRKKADDSDPFHSVPPRYGPSEIVLPQSFDCTARIAETPGTWETSGLRGDCG